MTDIAETMIQQVTTSNDGASVNSQTAGNTQTRFSFYNAQDFAPPKVSNEMNMPSPGKKENSVGNSRDSVQILRSLQEHEQQRLEILGAKDSTYSNLPGTHNDEKEQLDSANVHIGNDSEVSNAYEDAIKEALDLLRKHRPSNVSQPNTPSISIGATPLLSDKNQSQQHWFESMITGARTPPHADPILQSRGEMSFFPASNHQDAAERGADTGTQPTTPSAVALGEAYQAEIEARRKQRQERMARYATRLAELKQEDRYTSIGSTIAATSSSSDVGRPTWGSPHYSASTSWRTGPSDPALTSRSVPSGFQESGAGQAGSVTSVSKDEEVQRGVERVLLAILERASSQGRTTRQEQVVGHSVGHSSEWTGTSREEKKASSPEDNRPTAVSGDNADGNAIMRAMTDLLGARSTSTLGSHSPSRDVVSKQKSLPSSGHGSLSVPVPEIESSGSTVSRSKPANLTVDTSFDASGANRDRNPAEDELDRMVRTVSTLEKGNAAPKTNDSLDVMVRGVIDPHAESQAMEMDENERKQIEEAEEEADAKADDSYDGDHGDNPQALNGVLGPLSKNSGGTTGIVLEPDSSEKQEVAAPSLIESLSAAVSIVTGTLASSDNSDKYSVSNVDDETKELMKTLCSHLFPSSASDLGYKRPDWDESNPDEAGYRIIRLTTTQLSSVEYAFERVMERIKEADNDDSFERDLRAAEDLLDEAERKRNDPNALDKEIASIARIYPEEIPLRGFPGVKSTGRGEMGDLEYFHLPIIFKSHVTGFEPTKDLVLESGNVVAGQYLVEGELGSAAFSTAYRCVDLNSDGDGPDGHDEVCLKVIKNTKDFFDQSLDEIKILELLRQTGKCQEKNLVEMKTFFYHREHLVIVTELLRQNLFEFGKFIVDSDEEPYFTIPRLAYLTHQILISMDFIHRLGLVHSDIKPENILLASYSRAKCKVIDFGSSCFLTDRQSSYIQSRSYRAPEVILGLPYDGRIDIWSLGCVVAEMYTGEVTFQNDSIVSMMSRIEAICGPFPSHMIAQGRQSGRFFTRNGLLFEKMSDESSHSGESDDEDDGSSQKKKFIDIFQPKVTTLSARLGFSSDLMERYDRGEKLSREENHQAVFGDFVRKLLIIDPDKRPTAAESLRHPWMKYAESLTEEEIKYPSF